MQVGVNRVESVFLKLVCTDLVHKSDSATLLIKIDYSPSSLFLDHLHREMQLLTAFTPLRCEYIAGNTR